MSEFKGTPGPWSVDTDIDDGYGETSVISYWVRGAPHPNAPGFDGLVVAAVVKDCVENSEANAKLIAAAPELLAALEALTADRLFYIEGDTSGQMNVAVKAYEVARAAIAKATA